MIDSLNISATGMQVQQTAIDNIANNLANVNTTGFKKSRINFEDLVYRPLTNATGVIGNADANNPVGTGAAIANIDKVFTDGDLTATQRSLDLAIQGNGFFELTLPDGTNAYTRTGSFDIDRNGVIVNADGYPLSSFIQVPSDTQEIVIRPSGDVLVRIPGENELVSVGDIELVSFINASGLNPTGDNLYLATERSGNAILNRSDDEGASTVSQGFLEASNVDLTQELTSLLLSQRAYEINSRILQASDEVLDTINQLRR